MPATSKLLKGSYALVQRPRVPQWIASQNIRSPTLSIHRSITADEKPLPEAENQKQGPNQDQLPHVSEEAAATSKIMGEQPPDVEQGTPVEEVLKRDDSAKDKAPKVLKEQIENKTPNGTRSFSTSTRGKATEAMSMRPSNAAAEQSAEDITSLLIKQNLGEAGEGHLFPMPQMPIPKNMHLHGRGDPIVVQVVKLIMRSGRLSRAQRTMAMILERLRTAKPPRVDPRRPLVIGAPPASHLPLNPVQYLTLAIDSVAPLFRLRSQKGIAGGGVAVQIPVPLNERQRRRFAIKWILDAAEKRKSMGSGRTMFASKVADEIIAIVEGRSGVWEKRAGIHRLGVAGRANLALQMNKRR